MRNEKITINKNADILFNNNVDFCVGTGRIGLGLTKEYLDELELAQKYIGFSHIRGHGLFCDDMAIYHEYEENGETRVEYNYTYVDRVFDEYKRLGIAPFIELGFCPEKLASGKQTIFYWKGNTTPPKNYDIWCDMIVKLLIHLMDRYGKDEVLTWPIEVWNEPNLPGFWEKADMQEYFKLFKYSFLAIKELNPKFTVGGPAICGVQDELWIRKFMEFCVAEKLQPDFVTRHHYTTDFPERDGHYGYANLQYPDDGLNNLKGTRDIIDSFPQFKGLPIHITEFNTSYIPNCPLHDTNENAAYLAYQLSRLGEVNESYSYWTFGDVFEEQGVPFSEFHGGFGLVAHGCVPKPTFHTFAFFKKLKNAGKCVHKDKSAVVMLDDNGTYRGVVFNNVKKSLQGDFTVNMEFDLEGGRYVLVQEIVDEETCNPRRLWHNLGEHANPSLEEIEMLKKSAYPFVTSSSVDHNGGKLNIDFALRKNAVVYFELKKAELTSDRGFKYVE